MDNTMEEKITVIKLPNSGFHFICMNCNIDVEYEQKFCPECGTKLNVGLQ